MRCWPAAGWARTHLIEIAAGGVAERFRPGQFVAVSVGGAASSLLLRRCVRGVPGDPPTGAYSGDRADRGRRARPRHRVVGRGPAGGAAGRGRPAGEAVPAAGRADRHAAGRRRVRLGPAVRAGRRAAGPGSAGSTSCSARPPTSGSSASWRPSGPPARSPSPPTTARSGGAGRSPTCCRTRSSGPARWRCTRAARCRCCARSARWPRRTGCRARWPWRSRWPAASGCA